MSKFKVGDRVRYLACKDSSDQAWQNMTITRIDDEGYWADDDNPDYQDGYFPFARHNLEILTPPIPAPIAERMRGLIEAIANSNGFYSSTVHQGEARAIMAELVPVSVDTLEARAALLRWQSDHDGNLCDHFEEAIRKGRELEREGR